MLKVEYFGYSREEFERINEFLAIHPARSKAGMSMTPEGGYIYYEEGEPMDKFETIARLVERIRDEKDAIFNKLPDLELFKENRTQYEREMEKMEKTIDALEDKKGEEARSIRNQLKLAKDQHAAADNIIVVSENDIKMHRLRILAIRRLIKEVENGRDILTHDA